MPVTPYNTGKVMKIKTQDLSGTALDWAVGVCEGMPPNYFDADDKAFTDDEGMLFCPSTNWAQGGPIIERTKMTLDYFGDGSYANGGMWMATFFRDTPDGVHMNTCEQEGPTPLIAAMRCYVASKLGDEIEVPNELGE